MTIGQRIRARRLELDLTVDEVAEAIGKNRATVYRYESGEIEGMPIAVLENLARALRTTPGDLLVADDSDVSMRFPNLMEIGKATFPLYSGIACGEPILMDSTIETYVSATTDIRADFILRAVGDSMAPGIMDGDLVFIRSQPMVDNGQIAAVAVDDGATLKRVFWYPKRRLLLLKADNPTFGELIYQDEELEQVHVLGLAIAFQRDVT